MGKRAPRGAGGNLAYTLKDQENPMRLPTAALAVDGSKVEYSPRTKISMMSRMGSKPMIAIQQTHHVELAKMGMTPTAKTSGQKNRSRKARTQKKNTSKEGLAAIPETLTSGKVLSAPARKSAELVAPPPMIPSAPLAPPPDDPQGL